MATNRYESKNVLFVALSGIGNFLMQLPTIEAFKEARPKARITVWVAPRGTKVVAEASPFIDSVIEAPIKTSLLGHIQMNWKLAQRRFDTGIVLSPGQLVKSAAYTFLAGIPIRVGNTYPFRGQQHSRFLLTHPVIEEENRHDIEQNLCLLEPLQIPTENFWNASYHLHVPEDHQVKAREFLKQKRIPTDKHLVGIHAGSAPDFPWKRWPLDRFSTVARHLIDKQNAHVLLFGGPDEDSQKEELRQLINHSAVTSVSAPLLTTAAIMRHLKYVITNDSGLMHLAAASGVKVFGFFGPTDEIKTGPRGIASTVIRAENTVPVYNTEENYNLGSGPHETMLSITPELVISTILTAS
ncbi:MAG: glycosyltransferase family 9 protein [Candidatus Andersenbacteria bacterium]